MVKLKYTWAFVVAVLGNIMLYVEITLRPIRKFLQTYLQEDLDSTPIIYGDIFASIVFLSFGILMINQIWLTRFKGDQKWPLTLLGLCFPVLWGLFYTLDKIDSLNDDVVYGVVIGCLASCMIFYSLRFRKKPSHIQSQLGFFKWLIGLGILLIPILILLQERFDLVNNTEFISNTSLFIMLLLSLQIALPIVMLLNVIDLHKRDKKRAARAEFEMIESLGKK